MKISVAVVAYNEAETLPKLLLDIAEQDYPHEKMEVLLIDSGSSDGTLACMEAFSRENHGFSQVAVLENPGKTLPHGCNIALEHYTGDAIVRIDAHASVPPDFISKNVRLLESGEKVCGGARPNMIDGTTPWKETLLAAETSMFGSSIASYRSGKEKKYVSSVFHGMYRREVYDAVGPYDVRLARTEDNDMSYRIQQAGYRICYDPEIVSYEHTRSSLKKMLRQKYLNGYWIGRTLYINPRCFSLFHFVPGCFVLGILVTSVLALLGIWQLAALMWALYLILVLAMTALEFFKKPALCKLLLPAVFFLLHAGYGAGTLWGILRGLFEKIFEK